jgi:hypothetical protein
MSARNIKECGQGTLKLLPQAVQQSINTSLWEDIFFLVPSTKGIYWVPFSRRDTIPEQEQAKIVPVLKLFVPFPTENESLLRNKAIARIRRSYPLLSSTEDKQGINILILPNVTHIQTLLEQTIKTQQDLLAE